MKKTLQLMAGLMMGGFMALSSARGQVTYSTPPYNFVTIAGTAGDLNFADGTNSDALFYFPQDAVMDTNGNLYVTDNYNNNIRKLTPQGTNWVVTTIAGSPYGVSGPDDGTNLNSTFNEPAAIAIDGSGNLYVTDSGNNIIRKIAPIGTNWVVSTIAGTYDPTGGINDGTNGDAQFRFPYGITVDANTNLYVSDTYNHAIRKVAPVGTNWVVSTIAGTAAGRGPADGTNDAAQFNYPYGIAVDGSGNLYVVDQDNDAIRKIVPMGTNWVVTTIVGTAGSPPGFADATNGAAQFYYPSSLALGAGGNLFVTDSGNNAIRMVTPVGTNWVTVTLGGASDGSGGSNDGTGPNATFSSPSGIAVDKAGNVYVCDTGNGIIRKGSAVATGVSNLTISLTTPNTVMVSWTGSGTLQTNANLATPNWGNYGGEVNSSNGVSTVTLSPLSGNLFFRLTN